MGQIADTSDLITIAAFNVKIGKVDNKLSDFIREIDYDIKISDIEYF